MATDTKIAGKRGGWYIAYVVSLPSQRLQSRNASNRRRCDWRLLREQIWRTTPSRSSTAVYNSGYQEACGGLL